MKTELAINHQARAHSSIVGGSTAKRVLNCTEPQLLNRKTPEAAPEVLREWLAYEPETGALTWRKSPNWSIEKGAVVGSLNSDGYRKFKLLKVTYAASRAIWAIVFGYWPSVLVDHENGATDDNRLLNLRLATNQENTQNRKKYRAGLKGATWSKAADSWAAQIHIDGRNIHLGLFGSEQTAHAAYCAAAVKYFGVFARFE